MKLNDLYQERIEALSPADRIPYYEAAQRAYACGYSKQIEIELASDMELARTTGLDESAIGYLRELVGQ